MSDLKTKSNPETKPKGKQAESDEQDGDPHQTYIQTSQGLFSEYVSLAFHTFTPAELGRASLSPKLIAVLAKQRRTVTDTELLAFAANADKFLAIHRQADPESRETMMWDTRLKDLKNSARYKAAAGNQ